MARFRYKHIQSTVENREPSSLLDGEIAVNRFAGKEKLFIKNSNGNVVSFSSDSAIDGKLAEKLSVSDFDTYSGAVDTAINLKASESDLSALSGTVTGHTADTDIHVTTADKTAWNGAVTSSHTHSNKAALDAITGNVGTMAYENTSSYSSATQVNTALSNKLEASDIADFFDDAKYEDSGTSKVINFYHGNTIKATINADDFIVDGMISGVTLESKSGTTYLVIEWNTDAGIQTTELNIGDIFEADNYYTKSETSGKTEISTALGTKVNSATYTAHTADTSAHFSGDEKENLDSLATNIAAISGITATKVGNWDTAYTNNHTHGNKSSLDSITGNVGTMAYENASSYSSATEVNSAFEDINDIVGSGFTSSSITDVIIENEEIVTTAINDLDDRKLDKSTNKVTVTAITTNKSSSCSITGASNDGNSETIIYTNSTNSNLIVTVPTTYKTPNNAALEIICLSGGYCEVSYINVNGVIYARAI